MKNHICVTMLLGLMAHSVAALAEDQAVVSTARELAKQGFQAYDAERYAEAAEKLQQAYQVVKVPTLAVQRARALVKLGKFIEASELYLEAAHLPRAATWQSIQDDALRDAERERGELLPRIPRLKIVIEGADAAQISVTIDNVKVPAALVAAGQMVDPGQRTVVGKRGQEEAREVVSPKEGEQLQVKLRFSDLAAAGVPVPPSPAAPTGAAPLQTAPVPPSQPAATGATAPAPLASAPASVESSKPVSTQKVLGWVGVAMGGAGLIVGVLEGIAATSKRDALIATGSCPDEQHCVKSLSGDVSSYRAARTLSTIGFVAGGILATAGVTLLVLPSKRDSEPYVALQLGPSYVGLYGAMQ